MTTNESILNLRVAMATFVSEQYAQLNDLSEQIANEAGEIVRRLDDAIKDDLGKLEAGFGSVFQEWMTPSKYAWAVLENRAECYSAIGVGGDIVVLTNAQHPLTADGKPGPEYRARLDTTLDYAEEYLFPAKKHVVFLCVGGVHEGSDVSLAAAGARYVHDRLKRTKFTNYEVVTDEEIFSGNDEDHAAIKLARERGIREISITCSDGQYMRSCMACALMGVSPNYEQVTVQRPHQKTILELAGPWSVAGYLEKGPVKVFIEAKKTAERHKREAEEAAAAT